MNFCSRSKPEIIEVFVNDDIFVLEIDFNLNQNDVNKEVKKLLK